MKSLIELICRAHPIADGLGPLITPMDGVWAYCEGHGADGHDWIRIEPTPRDRLGDLSQLQELRAS